LQTHRRPSLCELSRLRKAATTLSANTYRPKRNTIQTSRSTFNQQAWLKRLDKQRDPGYSKITF